jgi:hypothetical protein
MFDRRRGAVFLLLVVLVRRTMCLCFRNMSAGFAGSGDFRAMSNRAFRQTGW